ncbi:hypothetical protein C8R47DRAFT_751787 [Mycena vitilis]|nr:hypothetical protein C8R47DRAFT_751787 [Mycena vitilis]
MPKAAKSSPTKTPPKPRPVRTPRKKPTSKQFIDDEADEARDSDNEAGVLVNNPGDPVRSPSDAEDNGEEVDEYEKDFINDGDPFENASERSASITPPPRSQKPSPIVQNTRTKAARKKSAKDDEDVIELTTSEEDLEAMDEDDSMFRKPAGVKPAALPPSLLTRSAAAKRASSPPVSTPTASRKKSKQVISSQQEAPSGGPPVDVKKFMEEWKRMNDYYDGNLATMISGSSGSKSAQSKTRALDVSRSVDEDSPRSPNWDPPFDGLAEPDTSSLESKTNRSKFRSAK